jgi:hemerythrin-like domain-containing protein
MNKAVRIIRDEHRSITAVLHGLQHLARESLDPAVRPRFEVFRAMLHYIDAFPERLHHPKEDGELFARVSARVPESLPLVDRLRAEHIEGAQRIRDLERLLAEFEQSWPRGARAFSAAVENYCGFHWRHMQAEEQELLPLAERALAPGDWREIEAAFAGNQDPIADLREKDFAKLFTRIVSLAPEPLGLGARWR